MKTNIRLVIGATIAALGGAITLISEAKVGGVYWSNRGSVDVVVKRGCCHASQGYCGGRSVVAGTNGACARDCYGRNGCVRY